MASKPFPKPPERMTDVAAQTSFLTRTNPALSEPPSLLDLPVEIRLKKFEELFSDVTITFEITKTSTGHGDEVVICRDTKHCAPFAILRVNRQIWKETSSVASMCPIALVVDCRVGPCPWSKVDIPNPVRRQITSITTNEIFPTSACDTITICSSPHEYRSLRRVEIEFPVDEIPRLIQGPSAGGTQALSQVPFNKVSWHFQKMDPDDYRLSISHYCSIMESWADWAWNLRYFITSMKLTFKMPCKMEWTPHLLGKFDGHVVDGYIVGVGCLPSPSYKPEVPDIKTRI